MEQLLLEKMPHVSYYEQLCRFLSNSSEKRRIGAIDPFVKELPTSIYVRACPILFKFI